MEPAVLSVASPAPQIVGGSGALAHLKKSTLALEEPKSLLFSLLTSGLAFIFIFQHSAGGRTLLWGQSRRFSVCGAGQGRAVRSRMCLSEEFPGECWREPKRGSLLLSQERVGRAEQSM